nr:Threonyl alanyl tRNA synthetase domain containing protein [Haemonchus contortus]
MRAHSATHLLNWALRRVGAGRGQRGSSIDEDSLRFDYATDDCAGEDDIVCIEHVESLIANVISEGRDVKVEKTALDVAAKIRNLQSEFKEGKAYPSVVRVARVGDRLEDALAVECCSGTHVLNTSSIMDFAVMSDRSLAKGVRRMLAVTGERALANRRYGEVVESRLESELEELNRGNHVEPHPDERIEWDRIPYLYNEMLHAHGTADCSQEIMPECTDNGSVQDDPARIAEVSLAEVHVASHCKEEADEPFLGCASAGDDDNKERSLLEMVENLSADIEAFREAADELETMSESVQCLMRNTINGDGRPVGAWKDVC